VIRGIEPSQGILSPGAFFILSGLEMLTSNHNPYCGSSDSEPEQLGPPLLSGDPRGQAFGIVKQVGCG